ncbi:serine/threonine protein kinase, partial [Micromonospora sp. NPDC051296]
MDAQPAPAADTRPCAHCGRDVPQRVGAGRPFRYCRDNDGACQRASRNSRMRHRNAPGLPGQVARTWEAVDRLDQIVGTLTEALHAELSPAGVQRQLAQVRAETAGEVAAAQTERDEAVRAAEDAAARAERERRQAQAATAERDADRAAAADAADRAAAADAHAERAEAARDDARRATAAAEALRTQAESDRDTARAQLGDKHHKIAGGVFNNDGKVKLDDDST